MIFSKEQTTLFLSQIVENFEGRVGDRALSQVVALYQEDADFSLKDFEALSIFLNSMNHLSPQGEIFHTIFQALSKKGVIDRVFTTLFEVRDFFNILQQLSLSKKNKDIRALA